MAEMQNKNNINGRTIMKYDKIIINKHMNVCSVHCMEVVLSWNDDCQFVISWKLIKNNHKWW